MTHRYTGSYELIGRIMTPKSSSERFANALLRLGFSIQQLKRIPRTGWLLRGIPLGEVENVASHTAGVALVALSLAETIEQPVDLSLIHI